MPPESGQNPRQAAEAHFRSGDLAACLRSLQAAVRADPADVKLRIFLAQLLMVEGDWERGLDQLEVIRGMDAGSLPMAQAYGTAIQCERVRAEVFAGRRGPLIFGEPEPWIAMLLQSLALLGEGRVSQAEALRAQAFESAPSRSGSLNGTRFEWVADADPRIGPVFEVLLNGAYYWVPMHRVDRITVEPPSDARDLVWLPAEFRWVNGGDALGMIPVRYPGSESADDPAVRLARKTEWREVGTETFAGLGQRLLTTDNAELGLLELRELRFDEA